MVFVHLVENKENLLPPSPSIDPSVAAMHDEGPPDLSKMIMSDEFLSMARNKDEEEEQLQKAIAESLLPSYTVCNRDPPSIFLL